MALGQASIRFAATSGYSRGVSKQLNIRDIDDDKFYRLRIVAAEHGMSVSAFIRWLIDNATAKPDNSEAGC
jgi:plasmid stability protein